MTTLNEIQSVVTHFSEQLKHSPHMNDVTIAGKIISVNPISLLTFNDDESALYSFLIDDYIGEARVYISQTGYEEFRSIIEVGRFVLIDGILNVIDKMPKKEYSVVAYDMKPMQ